MWICVSDRGILLYIHTHFPPQISVIRTDYLPLTYLNYMTYIVCLSLFSLSLFCLSESLLYGICVSVTENWHWSGIQTRTQTTRTKQRKGSKSCQRHMKFSQMVREKICYIASVSQVKHWKYEHDDVSLKCTVLELIIDHVFFIKQKVNLLLKVIWKHAALK